MTNTTEQAASSRRTRMPRAQRERQMLAVAEEVFAENEYVSASMDEIAERVGVSKPMLYEYFGSKEGLLVSSIRTARAELLAATRRSLDGAASPRDALRRGLRAFFVFIVEHRASWSLMQNESVLAAGGAVDEIEATRAQQTELMVTLMAAVAPEVDSRQREVAAEVVIGACERLATWWSKHPETTSEEVADYLLRVLWSGMAGLGTELVWPPGAGAGSRTEDEE
jgi:AcrR family transcriptional regulator